MAISNIYETKAGKFVLNSYFTDEIETLDLQFQVPKGTYQDYDGFYVGLSFYAPQYVESYPMIVPYEEFWLDGQNPDKYYYYLYWNIQQYMHDIRAELSEHTGNEVYIYLKFVQGNIAYIHWQKGYISIVNNTAPSIGGLYVNIVDSLTKELTGNVSTVISGITKAAVGFTITANKGSYLVGYKIKNGSKSIYYPDILKEETVEIYKSVSNCETGTFEVMAEDSRGFRTFDTITIPYIDYFKPTIHITNTVAIDPSGGATIVKLGGQAYNGSFGAVSNSFEVYVQYRVTGSDTWSVWYAASNPTFNGHNFITQTSLTGLDYRKQYEFRAFILDKMQTVLGQTFSEIVIAQGIPVFDWNGESFRFNVPVNIENGVNVIGITNIDGNTTITGDLNVLGNITVTKDDDDDPGDSNAAYENGHWLPKINCISSPTHAFGKWVRVGNMCIINFYIEGTTTSNVDKVEITNFPYTPESSTSSFRWQSGGGFCNNYAVVTTGSGSSSSDVNRDTHRFTGWSIEGGKLYGRTQRISSGTPVKTQGDSAAYTRSWIVVDDGYYIGAISGKTFRASGTLMYLIAGMEE